MSCWHVTIASERRLTLFSGESRLRSAVRCIDRVCGAILVLFCVVHDHVHLELECARERLGFVVGGIWRALKCLSRVALAPPYWRRVESRAHQRRLVDYFIEQTDHHGLGRHAALHSGSCFHDLIGARRLSSFRPRRLGELLPRLRLREVWEAAGLAGKVLEPAADATIRGAGAVAVVDAAAAAVAAGPELSGRSAPVVAARRTACHVAAGSGISLDEIAWALDAPRRTIRRLIAEPADPQLLRAARLQLALRELVTR